MKKIICIFVLFVTMVSFARPPRWYYRSPCYYNSDLRVAADIVGIAANSVRIINGIQYWNPYVYYQQPVYYQQTYIQPPVQYVYEQPAQTVVVQQQPVQKQVVIQRPGHQNTEQPIQQIIYVERPRRKFIVWRVLDAILN